MILTETEIEETFDKVISQHSSLLTYVKQNYSLIIEMAGLIHSAIIKGGCVYLAGNGGSAADSEHFAAELIGRYKNNRRSLPAMALASNTAVITAITNDYNFETIFARQLEAFCKPPDILIAISTSGKSKNILEAVKTARYLGLTIISWTGLQGDNLFESSDLSLMVPSSETARIQEIYMLVGHMICELLDSYTNNN